MVTIIKLTQLDIGNHNIVNCLDIQKAGPFQLKFQIYIFGVMILQMKQN